MDDSVHVRIARRKVEGKSVDGKESANGIWVKATVTNVSNSDVTVTHYNWGTNTENGQEATFALKDVRAAYD